MSNTTMTTLACTLATLAVDADREIALVDLSPDSIAYLLEYGLNKSLQDASAGITKAMRDAHAERPRGKAAVKLFDKGCETLGMEGDDAERMDSDAFGAAVAQAKRDERLAAIQAGKMKPSGLGSRLTGLARIARDVAVEMIRAACKAKGVKLPDADALATMAENLTAKNPAVMAEAERRLAQANATIDLDSLA